MPVWIHSSRPFAPPPAQPTPTQPATWPAFTSGADKGISVPRTPCARLTPWSPAYEYSLAPQRLELARAGEVAMQATASAARTAFVHLLDKGTSGRPARGVRRAQSEDRRAVRMLGSLVRGNQHERQSLRAAALGFEPRLLGPEPSPSFRAEPPDAGSALATAACVAG